MSLNMNYLFGAGALVGLGGFFYRNTTSTELAQISADVTKARTDLQEIQVAVEEINNQAAELLPVSESVATMIGAHKLEMMCKKAGLNEKAEQYKKMREELLNAFPIRTQVEKAEGQRLIGEITKKINLLIHAVENDEQPVNEEKYPEMFSNICWDIEQIRYLLSFENHENFRTILKEKIENEKLIHVGCVEWLKKIDVDSLLGIKK